MRINVISPDVLHLDDGHLGLNFIEQTPIKCFWSSSRPWFSPVLCRKYWQKGLMRGTIFSYISNMDLTQNVSDVRSSSISECFNDHQLFWCCWVFSICGPKKGVERCLDPINHRLGIVKAGGLQRPNSTICTRNWGGKWGRDGLISEQEEEPTCWPNTWLFESKWWPKRTTIRQMIGCLVQEQHTLQHA